MSDDLKTRCPFQVRKGYWRQLEYNHEGPCTHTIHFNEHDYARRRELEREFGEPVHIPYVIKLPDIER